MKHKSRVVALAVLVAVIITVAPTAADPAAVVPPGTGQHPEAPGVSSPPPWGPTPALAWPLDRLPPARPAGVGLDPLDAHWQSRFGLPVPNDGIRTLLPQGNRLIAGGWFTRIGRLEAPGLAAWNGLGWSLLGDFPGTRVDELAAYPGGLVAMGFGDSGLDVWHWTGSSWHSLGPLPATDPGLDMAVSNDSIAISVWVNTAGEWRSRVFLYAGQGWTALGDVFEGQVEGLVWYAGALHAGGETGYGPAADSTAAVVHRWNGEAWQAIDSGLAKAPWARVADLEVFNGELVAGGTNLDMTAPLAPANFVRWNGSTWATIGADGPRYPNLERMRVIDGDLYAIGAFFPGYGIARWDGTTWHLAEDALEARVYDVASYQSRLHAGGALSIDGSSPAPPLVVREDGQWRPTIDPGVDMHGFLGWSGPMVTGLTALDGAIFATGRFDFAGATGGWRRCPGGARWDGLEWSPLGFESFRNAYPYDLTIHDGAVHAVGLFSSGMANSGTVARLEGGEWMLVGGGSEGTFYNAYCIASAFGDLFVGGLVDPDNFRGIARWDGNTWDALGGVTDGSWITAIVAHGSDVIVAGRFNEVAGVACRNIAAWNPVSGWRPLGTGLDDSVSDLLSRDGTLYVSGEFVQAGGVAAAGIARWRDGRWEALPPFPPLTGGYYPWVWSLGWHRGRLVASGYRVPGLLASLEADGTWRAFGSGLDRPATSMVESGPSLFVGGYFSRAGSADAYGFAEWRENRLIEPSIPPRVTAAPNPFGSSVHLRYELAAGARVRVEVFDIAGHQVDRVFEGFQGAGPQEVAWRPQSSRIRPGVYFVRLISGGSSRIVRVVRVE